MPLQRWIKDLNISCNTIKVLEENIGRKISDIPRSNILTDTSLKAEDIKERINKWDLIKIKSFSGLKKTALKYKENLPGTSAGPLPSGGAPSSEV